MLDASRSMKKRNTVAVGFAALALSIGLFIVLVEPDQPVDERLRIPKTPLSVAEEDSEPAVFRMPVSDHSILKSLSTLVEVPDLEQATGLNVYGGANAAWATRNNSPAPDADLVGRILDSATPVDADDSRIRQWHFAPWFNATWKSDDGREWQLTVFLGGLATLESGGHRGAIFYSLDGSGPPPRLESLEQALHQPDPAGSRSQ